LNFANSLDKNDETLWNKTDGSPKIKLFKEHFGDEFNIKSVELKELALLINLALNFAASNVVD
jgi:hypothetical protein